MIDQRDWGHRWGRDGFIRSYLDSIIASTPGICPWLRRPTGANFNLRPAAGA